MPSAKHPAAVRQPDECQHWQRQLAVFAHTGEAVAAIDRTVGLGFEGDFGFAAAFGAYRGKEFAGGAGSVLAVVAAAFAALGFIHESALGIEFLFADREDEILAALFAFQSLVFH